MPLRTHVPMLEGRLVMATWMDTRSAAWTDRVLTSAMAVRVGPERAAEDLRVIVEGDKARAERAAVSRSVRPAAGLAPRPPSCGIFAESNE